MSSSSVVVRLVGKLKLEPVPLLLLLIHDLILKVGDELVSEDVGRLGRRHALG